jgi:hypothetical protein
MSGRLLYRDKQGHKSRHSIKGAITKKENIDLHLFLMRSLNKVVETSDAQNLIQIILLAKAAMASKKLTRIDMIVQLSAMLRIKGDDELISALRRCDSRTFEAVRKAQSDLISDILECNGSFIDENGDEWIKPIDIEFVTPPELSESKSKTAIAPYLPMGMLGLRDAISRALLFAESAGDPRGNKEKPYQKELARHCFILWRKYRPDDMGIWFDGGKASPIVDFSLEIFARVEGDALGELRLVELMKEARKSVA